MRGQWNGWREQRTTASRAPHPLAVPHIPPRPAPGAHLNHRISLARAPAWASDRHQTTAGLPA
jgi:hypothetical protein